MKYSKTHKFDRLIEEKIAKVPTKPEESLISRRKLFDEKGREIPVRGDAIVFPLQEESTDHEVVVAIDEAKAKIRKIIGDVDHIEISYPHLSFSGTSAPSSISNYLEKRLKQKPEMFEKVGGALQEFVDKGITCKAKECKMNTDGHIVARFEVNEKEELLECRSCIVHAISGIGGKESLYDRHKDNPDALERQTTLASVMFALRCDNLNEEQRKQIGEELRILNDNLHEIGTIHLDTVAWKEYGVRNLSEEDTTRTRLFNHRVTDEAMAKSAFGQGSNTAKAMQRRNAQQADSASSR